jgi:hypothetical protein
MYAVCVMLVYISSFVCVCVCVQDRITSLTHSHHECVICRVTVDKGSIHGNIGWETPRHATCVLYDVCTLYVRCIPCVYVVFTCYSLRVHTVCAVCVMLITPMHVSHARMIRLSPFFDFWIPREERRKEEGRRKEKNHVSHHTVRNRVRL